MRQLRYLVPTIAIYVTCFPISAGCGPSSTQEALSSSTVHPLGNNAYAVAFDARGRGAFVVTEQTQSQNSGGNNQTQTTTTRLCAEPAPDVAADVSAEATRALQAQVEALYEDVEARFRIDRNATDRSSSTVVSVAEQTEIVLVLRSAMYRICEMSLNRTIDSTQANAMFQDVLETVQFMASDDHLPGLIAALSSDAAQLTADVRANIVRTILAISLARMATNPVLDPDLRESFNTSSRQMLQSLQ